MTNLHICPECGGYGLVKSDKVDNLNQPKWKICPKCGGARRLWKDTEEEPIGSWEDEGGAL